jgi:Uri superfamily endonuclease
MQNALPREARTAHRYGRSTQIGAFADAGQEQQLGFRIDPLQVRLITSPDEPYAWSYMPEKAHLFQKHLSKHTMGACVELSAGVGKTFEAIKAPGAPDCLTEVDVSFTSKIEQLEQNLSLLQQDHIHVVEECERLKAQATENGQLRASAENELAAKKAELESAHSVIQDLRRERQVASELSERLQQQRDICVQEMQEISRLSNNVRSRLCTVAEPATV